IWEDSALENGRLIAEFERLQSRLNRSKEAYERNQDALRAIDSNQDNLNETVSVFEAADEADLANSGMFKQLLIGAVLGSGLGVCLIAGLAAIDNRIITANDLEDHFDHPLLGAIPFEGEAEDSERVLLRKDDERYVFAEACRNMRTSVLFVGEGEFQPHTFAVTSAIPSEGKSTVSANLAVALSFSHTKVLLVDADLRRGRLHNLFKCSREKGLMHFLEGKASFDEVIQKTNYEFLDMISIGGYPQHPAELLMGEHMDTLINEAQSKYDFVIFDTAPILATDDTTSFAGKLDTVLFAIRAQHTQVRQVKPAISRLSERNIRVSGLILNFVDLTQPGYYYYRYSEYYSDSGKRDEFAAK
ncbi:MAG: polysaccharide biosynthesis tyrosine autokinase, partial [Coraliomargarita sp.]